MTVPALSALLLQTEWLAVPSRQDASRHKVEPARRSLGQAHPFLLQCSHVDDVLCGSQIEAETSLLWSVRPALPTPLEKLHHDLVFNIWCQLSPKSSALW